MAVVAAVDLEGRTACRIALECQSPDTVRYTRGGTSYRQ